MKKENLNDTVHIDNERKANYYSLNALIIAVIIEVICLFLNLLKVFDVSQKSMNYTVLITASVTLVVVCVSKKHNGYTPWLKYLLLLTAVFDICAFEAVLGYNVTLMILFPVILSCHYYSDRLTMYTVAITIILLFLAKLIHVYYGLFDFNMLAFHKGTQLNVGIDGLDMDDIPKHWIEYKQTFVNTIRYSFIPEVLELAIIGPVCYKLSIRAKGILEQQKKIVENASSIKAELTIAEHIQDAMLPKILPTFPNRAEFDISASMQAAKEVGGDFYDFFFVDPDCFVIVIADVSGKGVPASMFMAVTKTLIKNRLLSGDTPKIAIEEVNKQICDGNDESMFVTVWLGVIDLKTGYMEYVNAGHNPPLIKKNDVYTYLRQKPNLVIGAMDFMKYTQYQMELEVGDQIYLYTDGVTEAMNRVGEQYGEERLEQVLNQDKTASTEKIIENVKRDVKLHVKDAEQSDDMTMLVFEWNGN